MTRSELSQILSEKQQHLTYKETENVVKEIFGYMGEALRQGSRIEIRGFGSFSLRYRKQRLARNPRTGQKVETQGKYRPYFRAGQELRDRVNADQ